MQQSDKHGPAIDEALKDDRHQSSDGTRHDGRPQDDPESPDDVAIAAEVSRFLGQAAFPGDAARLRATARMNQASEEVLRLLQQLPDGKEYPTVGEVLGDLGLHDQIEWGRP